MGDEESIDYVIRARAETTGQQASAAAFDKVTDSTKKLTDETERYQEALQQLAVKQEEAKRQTKQLSDQDAALIARSVALRKEISERQIAKAREVAERKALELQADREIRQSVINVSAAEAAAATASVAAAERATVSKRNLKDAVKGLAFEFPLLASVARLALNPIVLVVAAIGGAFAIFKYRVKEATSALAGFELPDNKRLDPARLNQAAEAWRTFAEAVRSAVAAYDSVDAASERATKRIAAEYDERRKNMESQKALALADLEGRKGTLTDDQYQTERSAIESRFGRAGLVTDWAGKSAALDEKTKRAARLQQSAKSKNIAAAGIRVASESYDATTEADYKEQATVAEAEIKERRTKIERLNEMRGSLAKQVMYAEWFHTRYGGETSDTEADLQRALATEQGGISTAQSIVGRYTSFARGKGDRAALRQRKGRLQTEAGAEAGEAEVLLRELPEDQKALDAETKGNVSRWNRAGLTELASRGLFADRGVGDRIFTEGTAALDAKAHGKKLTTQQEAQATALEEFITAIGWNFTSVIKALDKSTNKHLAAEAELKAIHARLDKIASQTRSANGQFGK